ncbi:MAG: hypothetical protein RIS35_3389 [Pseudomonadota bacterium]|jgi:cyanophycin synthetase
MATSLDAAPFTPAHWPSTTQVSLRIMLDLPRDPGADWTLLDAALLELLATTRIAETTAAAPIQVDQPVIQLTRRIVTIAGTLLRTIRYPSFDDGRVLSLEPSTSAESMLRATLRVPGVELMPAEVPYLAYRHAQEIALTLVGSGADRARTEFQRVHARFAESVSRHVPGGGSTVPILKAAHTLGIPFSHLGRGLYLLGQASAGRKLDRSSIDLDSALGARACNDKSITNGLLQLAGLPVPASVRVQSAPDALEAARRIGFPVVIKPTDRERGEGVEFGLKSAEEVEAAFARARAISSNLLVERQLEGTCHRVLVADRTVVAVIRRDPKSVIGDGEHTVRQLIDLANAKNDAAPAHVRQTPFPCDALALECLQSAGLALDDIPRKDQSAPLRPIETGGWGGSPEFVTERIHPDNIALAVRAARLLGLRVLGLDLVSPDISVPWHRNGAGIIEANYAPQVLGMGPKPQEVIQALLRVFFPGEGRIPVHAFVGGTRAFEAARRWQLGQIAAGRRAFLCSHRETQGPTETHPLAMTAEGLFPRVRALLLDPDVDAIALVVQTDELLRTGLPVDRLDAVDLVDMRLVRERDPENPVEPTRIRALARLLRVMRRDPQAPSA